MRMRSKKFSNDHSENETDVELTPLFRILPNPSQQVKSDEKEFTKEETPKSAEDEADTISTWMMFHLTPLLKLGASKPLYQKDCGVPSKVDEAHFVNSIVMKTWIEAWDRCQEYNKRMEEIEKQEIQTHGRKRKKRKRKYPSVAWTILKSFGITEFLLAQFYYLLSIFFMFLPVVILEDLVKYFEGFEEDERHICYVNPWLEVVGLGIFPMFVGLLQTRSQVIMLHFSAFIRTALSNLVYRKASLVTPTAKALTTSGKVFNLMSNDAVTLQRITMFLSLGLSCPFLIAAALRLVYQQVGKATWVGVAVLLVSLPVNAILFAMISLLRRRVLKYADERVNMINELLNGIRIIKFYAWERPYGNIISDCRRNELKFLFYMSIVIAIGFSFTIVAVPIIQPILIFYAYTKWESTPLSAAKAFTTLTYFNLMRFPFIVLPMSIISMAQFCISISRIGGYLSLPEREEYVIHSHHPTHEIDVEAPGSRIGSVTMKDCSFAWKNSEIEQNIDSDIVTLKNVSCTIEAGSLVAVVGKVGSGKTSFLCSILGEMESIGDSKVYIPGGNSDQFLAYCPQTPWIINDTIRGNILFNRPFDQKRYDQVLHAAALIDDLATLPAGDMTAIGERGINLSGGQKARVGLARAIYSNKTKLMLLDDPLSSVDGHVGDHLFSQAICGDICKGVTKILVTHHVQFLPNCDTVIVLEDGEIKHSGRYEDLVHSGVNFEAAVITSEAKEKSFDVHNNKIDSKSLQGDSQFRHTATNDDDDEEANDNLQNTGKQAHSEAAKLKGKTLIFEEEREFGSVDFNKYSHYAKAGSVKNMVGFIMSQVLGRSAEVAGTFWLAYWSDNVTLSERDGEEMPQEDTIHYLKVYSLIGMIGIILLSFRSIFQSLHRLHASRKMHDDMLRRILRAPVSFYDVTPIGRILNRFSLDIDAIDLRLPIAVLSVGNSISVILGSIVAIIISTKGVFLVPLVPLLFVYSNIQQWFRKTSTELQRLTNMNNSPIFADFAQTLSGTAVIRAYNVEEYFHSQTSKSFDRYNVPFVLFHSCTNWLSLRLDILGGFVQSFIAAVALATAGFNFIPAGLLAVSLSFSIEATSNLKNGVRGLAKLEADMSSVERILFYTSKIPEEAPDVIQEIDPSPHRWPNDGQIEILNVSMRYRDGPLVLQKINISINSGEKIGVVGRTGSGKSSLMAALFRITEVEDGQIFIDGINIAEIGTNILRQKLSIIPQDPIMFSNTIRHNIDPFHVASDDELWQVLDEVELSSFISNLPLGLDELVEEGGSNFSQGQRQLICIARCLLKNSQILIMDEATASIDNSTDVLIQKAIRHNFSKATVITIAHRLNTIMDSDRVLVLENGKVAEFDTPRALLSKETGLFKDFMAKQKLSDDDDN